MVSAIGVGFERLLRWLYPGVLFLLLLNISGVKDSFPLAKDFSNIWEILFVIISVGFILYLIQAFVFNQIITLIFSFFGLMKEKPDKLSTLSKWADDWSETIWRRWGTDANTDQANDISRINNWLDYGWGTNHAASITVWLSIIFYCIAKDDSFLVKIPTWGYWSLISLLIISLLWHFYFLNRIAFRIKRK